MVKKKVGQKREFVNFCRKKQIKSLYCETNSLILEEWFSKFSWSSKLGACLLCGLINSKSMRLKNVGKKILSEFNKEIISTEGIVVNEELWAREIYLSILN